MDMMENVNASQQGALPDPPAGPLSGSLAGRLSQILDEVEGQSSPPPPEPAEQPTEAASAPVLGNPNSGALLGGLLSNPALLSAIPTLLENLSPLLSGHGTSQGGTPQSGTPQSGTSQGGTSQGGTPQGGTPSRHYPVDRHTALICAVKPYLGSERQAAADTILRLCRIWDALARSGVNLSGLLSTLGGGSSGEGDRPSHDRKEAP